MVFLQIFAPILLMLYLLFGGYFVTLDSVVVWLKWIKVLSPFKYGFAGVYLCQFPEPCQCFVLVY